MIVYAAADLLWATRIKGTADALHIPCRPVRSLEMLKARLGDSPVVGLIVDLDAPEVALELIRALRLHDPGTPALDPDQKVQIIAFGPHVAVELFESAKQAGADRVYARGAFDRQLPQILQGICPPAPGIQRSSP